MSIDLATQSHLAAKICIIGVGGAGGNAIDNMINRNVHGVTFVTANTDKQALDKTSAENKILLGVNYTKGLGAGAKPEVGKKAAEESYDEIKQMLNGYDLIFVTCGMGGGTGTGGSPVIAKIAKETGALVVGIVSKCFTREGNNKKALAEEGIARLKEHVDAYIVVPNDKILEGCNNLRPIDAYHKANDILDNAISGIVDIIINDGFINVDFADVRTVLSGVGEVIIGIGSARGDNAPTEAVMQALNSPFFDGLSIKNSQFALINIKAGENYTIEQIQMAYDTLKKAAGHEIDIKNGEDYLVDSDEFAITIIAPASKYEKKKLNTEANLDAAKNKNFRLDYKAAKNKQAHNESNEKLNLFNNSSNESDSVDIFNPNSKITNVAATRNDNISSIEMIGGQVHGSRFGRPHGEDELKAYDQPAYIRKGKESKYNYSIDNNVPEVVPADTLPEDEEKQKLQKLVNTASEMAASNPFIKYLADSGVKFQK